MIMKIDLFDIRIEEIQYLFENRSSPTKLD